MQDSADWRGGEMVARGKCLRGDLKVGQKTGAFVYIPLALPVSLASGAASFVRQAYFMRWIS